MQQAQAREQQILAQEQQRQTILNQRQVTLSQQRLAIQQQRDQQEFQRNQTLAQARLAQKNATDQANLAILQNNTQIENAYKQEKERVKLQRQNAMDRYEVDRLQHQRGKESRDEQVRLNNEAANRSYTAEQTKLSEARKKAAFARQASLAKMIGAKGAVLASGRTGQSIGLLANDAERQAGFELAQADATLESAKQSSLIGMETAFIQSKSANQQANNQVPFSPITPYLPEFPGIPTYVDPFKLETNSYG